MACCYFGLEENDLIEFIRNVLMSGVVYHNYCILQVFTPIVPLYRTSVSLNVRLTDKKLQELL